MVDREPGVKTFSYADETLDELETALSRERLSTYLDAAGGDRQRAILLHAWNTAVSAAFYGPLQGLEVMLRNAMHRRLAERYGPAWYDDPGAGLNKLRANMGEIDPNSHSSPALGSTYSPTGSLAELHE